MTRGKVTFVGAGPGAPDLITLRGATAIAAADVVVWASSLVHEGVLGHARPGARVLDSAAMSLEVSPPLPCFGRPPPASGARLLPLAGG